MKKTLLIILGFMLLGSALQAQILKPVKWSFSSVPIKGKTGMYEVHLTATIDKTWKIYSGSTPAGGPSATLVKFKPNASVLLGAKVKEIGALYKVPEPAFGVDVWYYKDKVDFVQIIKLKKPGVKTSLSGTIEFMACDAEQCLPPEEVSFKIELK